MPSVLTEPTNSISIRNLPPASAISEWAVPELPPVSTAKSTCVKHCWGGVRRGGEGEKINKSEPEIYFFCVYVRVYACMCVCMCV